MIDKILDKFTPEVLTALILKAKKGDVAAMKLFFELKNSQKPEPEGLPVLQVVEIPNDGG